MQKRQFVFSQKEKISFRHYAFQSTSDAFLVFKILPLELQIIHHCHCWNWRCLIVVLLVWWRLTTPFHATSLPFSTKIPVEFSSGLAEAADKVLRSWIFSVFDIWFPYKEKLKKLHSKLTSKSDYIYYVFLITWEVSRKKWFLKLRSPVRVAAPVAQSRSWNVQAVHGHRLSQLCCSWINDSSPSPGISP